MDDTQERSEDEKKLNDLKELAEKNGTAEVEAPKEDIFKNKYYYLAAEMDNMKKRFEREKESIVKYGNEKILKAMIDVVDDFDRTVDMLKSDNDDKIKNIMNGIDMVRKKLADCLLKNGLESVESIGKIFDPNFHEAVAVQPISGKKEQEIITEYQKGYLLNGRLLRAAKVIIATDVKNVID